MQFRSGMKVLHVSPSFYPTKAYGGTIRSGYGLCRGLAELGCSVRVLTADTDGPGHTLEVRNDEDVQVDALRVHYCHKQFRHSISFGLLRVLPEYVEWADVVHLTAVYSVPTFPTLSYCRLFSKPMVWSPRGFAATMGWIDSRDRQVLHGSRGAAIWPSRESWSYTQHLRPRLHKVSIDFRECVR